jgi:chromosome segregation ATPase
MSANTNATVLARLRRSIQEAEDLLRRLEQRKEELKRKQENMSRSFSEQLQHAAQDQQQVRLLTQARNRTVQQFLDELSIMNNNIRQVEYSIRTFKEEADRIF